MIASLLLTAEDSMSRSVGYGRKVCWWNRELEMESRYIRTLRRKITGRCSQEERQQRKLRCRQARNRHFNTVRNVKRIYGSNLLLRKGKRILEEYHTG